LFKNRVKGSVKMNEKGKMEVWLSTRVSIGKARAFPILRGRAKTGLEDLGNELQVSHNDVVAEAERPTGNP
jgi:hypothetical protein